MNPAIRRLGKGLLYTYLAYLLLSLLVVLPALNILAPRLVREATDRELRSELLLFNPFNLAVEARGVSLTEKDGHRPLAFRRFLADLSLASLWQPGIVLDRIWLDDLDVHVLRYENGEFHFADLLEGAEDDEAADDSGDGDIPAMTLRDLRITAHTLAYTDRTRPGPFRTVQTDLGLHSSNITTVPGRSGDGRLELIGDGGGRLSWRGALEIGDGRSRGEVDLRNIDLTHLWRYEAENLAFVADSARLDLRFNYSVDWNDDVDLKLASGNLVLHDIDLEPANSLRHPDTYARLQELALQDWEMDLLAETASADLLRLLGFELAGFDEGDTISLVEMFLPAENGSETAGGSDPDEAGTGVSDAETEPALAWQLRLAQFSMDDSGITWRTPRLKPEQMRVHPLRITASELAWPATAPSPFATELAINDVTRLATEGELHLGSGDGRAQVRLTDLELPWLDPTVQEQLRTDLKRGRLALESELQFADFAPTGASFDITLTDFATVLHETQQEAFSLGSLGVTGGEADLGAQRLHIAEVSLQRPAGSLRILETGDININGVLRELPEGAAADGADGAETSVAPEEAAPWRVIVDRILLADGRLDFADESLPLPFRTMIESIEAEVRDIDTASETPLTVTLNGNVDGYAPVIIEGSGTPLGEVPDGRLRFRFRGVDIATMSPYSGTYAGYKIDSGTLSLDLRYALAGQELEGDNRIVISQMKLGEPVTSDLAVDVPLKLGIALLTDSKGVIDLSVPVSGNVDDPQFSISKVVGRAIMNVITKAVTAPFKLLAGLVGSDADLENIAFAEGSTELSPDGDEALRALAEALQQRPQLSLRVQGYADPVADGRALREQRLGEELVSAGLPPASLEARDAAWGTAVAERYAAQVVNDTTAAAGADAQQSEAEAASPTGEEMWQALIDTIMLPAAALEDLGIARAAAAKRDLVTLGGVDAARIAISYDTEGGRSAVHMVVDG
jgi:hypothetical protein